MKETENKEQRGVDYHESFVSQLNRVIRDEHPTHNTVFKRISFGDVCTGIDSQWIPCGILVQKETREVAKLLAFSMRIEMHGTSLSLSRRQQQKIYFILLFNIILEVAVNIVILSLSLSLSLLSVVSRCDHRVQLEAAKKQKNLKQKK